ncbi:ABC transporter substrate-binding protein [Consotaella sp. CSK11QG-6]
MLLVTAAAMTLSTAGQAAELRMSWWGGDSRHQATQEALKACGEKYGHTIKPEFTGFSGHQEKLTTQIAGSTEADIMQVNWPWLPLLSPDGTGFADLRDYSDTIDLSQYSEDDLAAAEVKGHLNGIPVSTTGRVFLFNKDTFDKAGLAIPSTWDELTADAKVMKEKLGEDYYPFEAAKLNAVLVVSLVVTQKTGKDLVDPETGMVAWTPEELADGIKFYQNLVDSGTIRSWKDVASDGKVELFETQIWGKGEIAGTYEWDSTYAKYADPLGDQYLAPTKPLMVDGATTEGVYRKPSMLFSISKNSKNPKAAAQIVNCLLNEPEGYEILKDTRGIPSSKVAFEALSKADAFDPKVVEAHEIIMNATGPTASPHDENPDIREIFKDSLEAVAYGQMTAEDAAEDMIEQFNDELEDIQG